MGRSVHVCTYAAQTSIFTPIDSVIILRYTRAALAFDAVDRHALHTLGVRLHKRLDWI